MFERRPEFVSKAGVGHNYQTNHLKLDGDAGDDSKMPGPPLTARQAKEWASQKTIGLVPGRVAVFQCFQPQAGMPSTPNYLATRGLYPKADMAVLLLPANNLGFRANASRPNTTPGVTAPGLHQPPIPGGCFRVASRTNENRFTRVA